MSHARRASRGASRSGRVGASASRQAFVALPTSQQQDVIAFLDDLVLYKVEHK
jgi:hypothetical protein